jgi:hypothetical protein
MTPYHYIKNSKKKLKYLESSNKHSITYFKSQNFYLLLKTAMVNYQKFLQILNDNHLIKLWKVLMDCRDQINASYPQTLKTCYFIGLLLFCE